MTLIEARTQHHAALTRADAVVTAAEIGRRPLTRNETLAVDTDMAAARELGPMIATMERRQALTDIGPLAPPATATRTRLSAAYLKDFQVMLKGGNPSAALYEGSSGGGGFAVPSIVYGQIVQLAPADNTLRQLATVMPTTKDIRFPVKAVAGTAAAKAETGASTNYFTGTNPTLGSVPLSAFMAGIEIPLSFEIVDDVPSLLTFLSEDGVMDLDTYEENLFISGTGVGQAQGLIGNVGAGVSLAPDAAGNLVNPDGLLDLVGSVKAKYLPGASFLMQRATAILARQAQRQANLYEPVWTRENGVDLCHGYPVAYSASMPAAAVGNCPVLFGNFKLGYIIGQRGGVGLNMQVLDQALASTGLIQALLYRRVDGRVRIAEAIQGYNIT